MTKSVTWDTGASFAGGLFLKDGVLRVWVADDAYNGAIAASDRPVLLELVREAMGRQSYEPPAIESTVDLAPRAHTAAEVLAAAQLTPEQIEERRAIGARREPKRTAALANWMKRSIEHAAAPCAECQHARGAHTPDCEECDCERFTDVIDAEFDG
jgi:hypothetical protein